jgi:hypothetical protein
MLFSNKAKKQIPAYSQDDELYQEAKSMVSAQPPLVEQAVTPAKLDKTNAVAPQTATNRSFNFSPTSQIQNIQQAQPQNGPPQIDTTIDPQRMQTMGKKTAQDATRSIQEEENRRSQYVPPAQRNIDNMRGGQSNMNSSYLPPTYPGQDPATAPVETEEDKELRQNIKDFLSGGSQADKDRDAAARKAAETELDRRSAENIENVRARTGVAGMGLTGAAASLESGAARADARNKTLTLEERDKAFRDEQLRRMLAGAEMYFNDKRLTIEEQRARNEQMSADANFNLAEELAGRDINRDGLIAGEPAATYKTDAEKKAEEAKGDNLQGTTADPVIVDVATRMMSRYPALWKDQAGAIASMTAAKTAFASWSAKNPGVTFEQYVQNHLDYWSGPGGYLTRGVTLGQANETQWPT